MGISGVTQNIHVHLGAESYKFQEYLQIIGNSLQIYPLILGWPSRSNLQASWLWIEFSNVTPPLWVDIHLLSIPNVTVGYK